MGECGQPPRRLEAGLYSGVVDGDKITLDGLPFEGLDPDERGRKILAALAKAVFSGADATNRAWHAFFAERLMIVSDDDFTWFTQTATDVRAHVRIGNTGTVEGARSGTRRRLLPETLLAGIVQVAAVHKSQVPEEAFKVLGQIASGPLQVGGDATTGAGRVRLVIGGGGA